MKKLKSQINCKNDAKILKTVARTMSVFLSLVICISAFAAMAFAGGETTVSISTEAELLQAITDAGSNKMTIEVTDDITFTGLWFMNMAIEIPAGADITIKASGKNITLTRFADETPIFNIAAGGKLTLSSDGDDKLTIDGNKVSSTTAAIVSSGTFVSNDVEFINHIVTEGKGSAIYCSGASSSCTLNGGIFKDNQGQLNGGAIAVENSAIKIDGTTFENNKVSDTTGSGGAIYCKTSSVDFNNGIFTANSAMVGGAVEFTAQCTGTIKNSVFKENRADGLIGKGGALDFDECVAVSILSGTFENNYASSWGGAIYTDGAKSDFFMNTVLFENNSASMYGGAIWHCPLGTAHYYTYSGMMFWNNTATMAGSDMYLSYAKPGLENGGEYVSDKTYSGSSFNWCYDTASSRFDSENPQYITDKSYYQGSNLDIAMKSNITKAEYLLVKDAAGIIFKGNSAAEGGAIANNGFVEVGYKSGLTVEKKVTGDNAPADDVFTFKVEFSDGNTYDGIESGGTFSIKAGERKLISDIPVGVVAVVSEITKNNYTAAQASQEAVIGEYGSEMIFVNHYTAPVTGDLTVSKTVTGTGADTTISFSFTVTLGDTSISGNYGDMSFANGIATFTLKDGESKTASGLPENITYTVEESDNEDYTVTKTNDSGTIVANKTVNVSFNNHKDIVENKITVTVKKVWQEENGSSRPSSISVQLYKDGDEYGDAVILSADNNWQFEWDELESDSEWTVDEVNVPDGYTKTVSNTDNVWTITNKEESTVPGTTEPPQTGDCLDMVLWISLLVVSGTAITLLGITEKRRKMN